MSESCLQWVRVDGSIRHVSDFADLESNHRPDAYCPLCGKLVILKLGDIRTHHAAHYEGTLCAISKPETVIHLNSKYHLQNALRSTDRLCIWQGCSGWSFEYSHYECHENNKISLVYSKDWDRVELEWPCGKYRLDVALLHGGKVVCAIEVLVSHPSETDKIKYLNQQGIAWVEVRVTPDFYSAPKEWSHEIPLEPERYNKSLVPAWLCSNCEQSFEKAKNFEEKRRRDQEERQRKKDYASQFEYEYIRLVDFYYPSGKYIRKLYIIQKRRSQGRVLSIDLQEVTDKRRQIDVIHPPINNNSYEQLKLALEKELDRLERPDWVIDRARDWQDATQNYRLENYRRPDTHPYFYEHIKDKWQRKQPAVRQERPPWRGYGIEIGYKSPPPEDPTARLFKEYTCTGCGKVTSDWISGNGATKTCLCRDCGYKK